MLKYLNTEVVFQEIPDEVTLAINITQCPCHCIGCHSEELAEDVGNHLYTHRLKELIQKNEGISCVCFMGGDIEPRYINLLAKFIKDTYSLKVGWYSGRDTIAEDIALKNFDFIKVGSYREENGGLQSPSTNQKMYQIYPIVAADKTYYALKDITNKFWNNEIKNKD